MEVNEVVGEKKKNINTMMKNKERKFWDTLNHWCSNRHLPALRYDPRRVLRRAADDANRTMILELKSD